MTSKHNLSFSPAEELTVTDSWLWLNALHTWQILQVIGFALDILYVPLHARS